MNWKIQLQLELVTANFLSVSCYEANKIGPFFKNTGIALHILLYHWEVYHYSLRLVFLMNPASKGYMLLCQGLMYLEKDNFIILLMGIVTTAVETFIRYILSLVNCHSWLAMSSSYKFWDKCFTIWSLVIFQTNLERVVSSNENNQWDFSGHVSEADLAKANVACNI